ncbi:cupin domain-containing protein [Novosphingobium terrae]|uniref:cupin domain-containing protein n=1 Tax=Novosphingobium terrae TaxID=2726189 RepID=UPI00197F50FB|nr:cupin domain-containing protein [Novosphingobium terrae]
MEDRAFLLASHGWVPNNPRLPVIVYRQAISPDDGEKTAQAFEQAFKDHSWPPRWRDGIYDFHHYHSTAHEVLGVASGSATLIIGGPGGEEIEVGAGDAILLPVGTGHCAIWSSEDFLVVGAYPTSQDWDICREAPSQSAWQRIVQLPFPDLDPVAGADGPLAKNWHAT